MRHPCHAHHKTRTNTIETNKVAHMKTCTQIKQGFWNTKDKTPEPHHGDKPHKHKKSQNSIQIWTGFQQQITEYKKLMSYNKYLTTILASILPIFVFQDLQFPTHFIPDLHVWTLVFHSSSRPLSFWTSCIVAACYTFFVLPLCMCSTLSAT
jgi:hypothetical protein